MVLTFSYSSTDGKYQGSTSCGLRPLELITSCNADLTPALISYQKLQVAQARPTRQTYAVREAPHLEYEPSAWLQDVFNTAEDSQRATFAPVKNGIAENCVELVVGPGNITRQFQGLRISCEGILHTILCRFFDLNMVKRQNV